MPKFVRPRTTKPSSSRTYFLYYTLCTRLSASLTRTRSQVFDEGDVVEVPNYQFLCHYIISLNRSTGKLSSKNGSVSITSHWDAWYSLSTLHSRHSRHILHWSRGKVCGTVRAERPAQFQKPFALGAGPLELLTTGGADLEICFDTGMAVITCLTLGHLSQERFFF